MPIVAGVQNCGLYFNIVVTAGIALRKVYHVLPRQPFCILYCTKLRYF